MDNLDDMSKCLMGKATFNVDVMYKEQGNVVSCDRHLLTAMLLRPRRLCSIAIKHYRLFSAARSRGWGMEPSFSKHQRLRMASSFFLKEAIVAGKDTRERVLVRVPWHS